MLRRLRTDFQLSMITMLGACAVFGISPFAVYRFINGNIYVGIVDTAIVVGIAAMVIYAWRTGRTAVAGLGLAIFNSMGGVVVGTLVGDTGLYWLYVQFLSNFFLTRASVAFGVVVLALVALGVHGQAFSSAPQYFSFAITSGMVSLFAFIFAYRTELQRRQLESLAARDPLTGVGNRRMLEKELTIAVASAERSGLDYGLIMLDLDHFKQVNDRFGHEAGDHVLQELVTLIRANTRSGDRLFRFGGEEFVLLLPDVGLSGLHRAAENLRRKIDAELQSPGGPVTASLGVALLQPGEGWQNWLQRADAALYEAKRAGRNRTAGEGLDTLVAATGPD